MDPNANLAEQARLLSPELSIRDRRRRSELRQALRDWLTTGGFAPDWAKYPDATKAYRAWTRKAAKFTDLYH